MDAGNLPTDIADITDSFKGIVPVKGTIGATGNTTTKLHLDGLTYGNNEINGYTLVVFDNSTSEYHVTNVTDWVLSSELATVPTLAFTPEASTDTYWLISPAGVGAVWDEVLTGNTHNVSTSAGRRLRQLEQAFVMAEGVIDTATNTHTFTLDAGAVATADYYIGARLQIEEGAGAGQSRIIAAYSVGKVAILDSDFTTIPDASSRYSIVASDVHVSISDADLGTGFVAVYTNTTTITLDATEAPATTDFYVGEMIVFTHGTGAGQAREITAYTSGRVVTMSPALTTALDTTTTWHMVATRGTDNAATETKQDIIDANVDQLKLGIIFGTAQTGTLAVGSCTSNLTGYTNDQLIGRIIIFTAGPADGEATDITDYASANGLLTFTALTLAPENGNAFKIV